MKKGFTLVEVLGIIVLLGVMALFTVPALTKTNKESAEKQYEEYEKNIKIAAESYFHNETDGNIDEKYYVTVGTLIEEGYLKEQINPKTKQPAPMSALITITKNEDNTENYDFNEEGTIDKEYRSGLVLWYDGYTSLDENKWKDLVGERDATIENGINNPNSMSLTSLTTNGINYPSPYTLEITFSYSGDCNINPDLAITSNKIVMGDTTIDVEPNTKYTLSISMNLYQRDIYLNGKHYTSDEGVIWVNDFAIQNFNGKIYSIRIYNRAFTETDASENYMVDKYRFGV